MSFPSPALSSRRPLTRYAWLLAAFAAFAASAPAQVDIRINFQPEASPVPAGYIKDVGLPYDTARGYGWITEASLGSENPIPLDLTPFTRDRNKAGVDPWLNTLIHLRHPFQTMAAAFEYDLPAGIYRIVAGVGDPGYFDSRHIVNAEGIPVIGGFVGTAAEPFRMDSAEVLVEDGRLTLDAVGGVNTKLTHIRITRVGDPPAPEPVDIQVNFQDAATTVPEGHVRDFGQAYGPRTDPGQGEGWTYGWVVPGTSAPLDLSAGGTTPGNGRKRPLPSDLRLSTLMHMQGNHVPRFNGTPLPGSWELAVPAGFYTVTVGVGDAYALDSYHRVNVEGRPGIAGFAPSATNPFFSASVVVEVTDGRLTLDAEGGTNTKLTHVEIRTGTSPAGRPSVSRVTPSPAATGVPLDFSIAAEVNLPNGYIINATVDTSTVRLYRSKDNLRIPAAVNTSGGGDVLVLQPLAHLEPDQGYRFEVGEGVQDRTGAAFLPFTSHFTTGTETAFTPTAEVFDRVDLGPQAAGRKFTSLALGPDSRLYAATLTGHLFRYPVNPDGTLAPPQVLSSVREQVGNTDRVIIGLAFDPASTPDSVILWVTHNAPSLINSPEWSGTISRLSGADLECVQDFVVGLPRSKKDHLTNSLAFGPDGALYITQGSLSAMGAPDNAWGNRGERLLSGALLRVDVNAIHSPPLDVRTEESGDYGPAYPNGYYDPYAPGAPVTLHATGIRNAYDLLWHSNGHLYVPTNSSAANGNTPSTPALLPGACLDRIDHEVHGPYAGPAVAGITQVQLAQPDYLFRVEPGGYYGHPNPRRCEWVLNGGNPTEGVDPHEEFQYPVGTLPDRNWRPAAYDFGLHFSPNGILEYRSGRFQGALQSRLMVARYSSGKDILVLTVDPGTGGIAGTRTLNIGGGTGRFADPLDLAENPATGDLYVTEYAAGRITLLRPR